MTDLNTVTIIGRLTHDVGEKSFGYVSNGQARAMLSVATNRSKKVGDSWEDDVSYFDVTVWGKQAENLKPYFTKGRKLLIVGYLKQDRWQKGDEKKSKVTIVAERVELMDGKGTNETPATESQAAKVVAQTFNGEVLTGGDFNEDIPF